MNQIYIGITLNIGQLLNIVLNKFIRRTQSKEMVTKNKNQ